MKVKRLALLLTVGLVVLAVALAAVPRFAQAQGPNLLQNPGFEEGHYNQDGIAEITVPNGWRMHWSNNESNIFNGYAATARPETVVWNISGAPPNEKDLFWKDGTYTVKIFKGWAPLWAAMSQNVSGLEVGRRYRLVAPVYIDIVADYDDNGKVAPDDPRQGRVRLGASPVGTPWRDPGINYSGWWTAESVNPFYLAYPTFVHEFTATAPEMTVWIEVASNYPHPNNGFFIDTVGLYALDQVDNSAAASAPPAAAPAAGNNGGGGQAAAPAAAVQQAAPPRAAATPRADGSVVHVVQSGDSFWSLANQYAETMGITPEEALTAIPELNGNPSVITSGQELIIVPAESEAPAEEADATADADAAAGEDAAADAEATPEAIAAADTGDEAVADAETAANAEAPAVEAADVAAETAGGETAAEGEAGESNAARALASVQGGSVCVQAFEDVDGDGARAQQNEPPLPDNAITISHGGNTVSTYITDGTEDAYCFENLEADTYQLQIFPPADYMVTTEDSWAVAVADGVMIPVSFGLQHQTSAVADTGGADAAQADLAAEAPAAETTQQPSALNALTSNLGMVVLGIALVLVVIAGIGVVLLRRG